MTRGRKPKPIEIKRMAGNPGKRRLPDAPQFSRARMYAPKWMSREGREEWRRVVGELEKAGILTVVDRAALEAYCEAYARWVRAEKQVRRLGEIVTDEKGRMSRNPWLVVANKAMEQMIKIAAEFGFTPSARNRVHVATGGEDISLAELLFGNVEVVEEGQCE